VKSPAHLLEIAAELSLKKLRVALEEGEEEGVELIDRVAVALCRCGEKQ
jgi:CDGSH-type Zn-finger protein